LIPVGSLDGGNLLKSIIWYFSGSKNKGRSFLNKVNLLLSLFVLFFGIICLFRLNFYFGFILSFLGLFGVNSSKSESQFFKIENILKFSKVSEIKLKPLRKIEYDSNFLEFNKLIRGVDNLVVNHFKLEQIRKEIEFDIDGIVYKINSFDLQKRLGNVANSPRWAIAHKFSANKGISKILNIEIQVGRTGALTPVAKIKPINIGGVVVSNATLHNEDEIIRKDIRLGDTVKVERAGDVIPHVVLVDLKKRKISSKKFVFPKKCPCGFETTKEFNKVTKKFDAVRRCPDRGFECEKMAVEKIKHFISKEALNIDGLGKKVVEKFWDLELIRFPQDIFNLDYVEISKLEGWGDLSVSNLKYSIDQSKKVSLDRFIYSIGIRHIGIENAKLLAEYTKSITNFLNLIKNKKFKRFNKSVFQYHWVYEFKVKFILASSLAKPDLFSSIVVPSYLSLSIFS